MPFPQEGSCGTFGAFAPSLCAVALRPSHRLFRRITRRSFAAPFAASMMAFDAAAIGTAISALAARVARVNAARRRATVERLASMRGATIASAALRKTERGERATSLPAQCPRLPLTDKGAFKFSKSPP